MRRTESRSLRRLVVGSAAAAVAAWCAAQGFAEESARPASEPAEPPLVALGRRLFHDPTVSRTGRHACASCHDPDHGWSDAKRFSDDEDGPTRRRSQPVADLDLASKAGFHWDGEFADAAGIAFARLGDPNAVLMASIERAKQLRGKSDGSPVSSGYGGVGGNTGASALRPLPVPDRLAMDARYAPSFQAAFGDPKVTADRMIESIAAFVGTLRTERNPVDEALAGSRTVLSPDAARGLDLFRGKAACATCHVLDRGEDGRALLTDGLHHNTGVAAAQLAAARTTPEAPGSEKGAPEKAKRSKKRSADVGIVLQSGRFLRPGEDDGRAGPTGEKAMKGAFKTPSLRDVARRAPYMHDGSLSTLEEVVRYYAKGGTPNSHLDAAIRPIELSDGEVADLVAFLESLSGAERPGMLPARREERQIRVRILDVDGSPVAHLPVEVAPFGERLGKEPAALRTATTASDGSLSITFPQTTHVVLNAAGWELAGGRPIPDTAGDFDVVAAPLDRITVLLRGTSRPAKLEGTVTTNTAFAVPAGADGVVFELDGRFADEKEAGSEPETFVFTRLRDVDQDSVLYTAPLGRTRGRARLHFPGTDEKSTFTAAIDLDGGWSEPVRLQRVQRMGSPK